MSLKTTYERFLSSPNPLSLSESATLHYVTTLTSYTKQGSIIRHLENQNKSIVKKKAEKIISAVEGYNSIAVEVETTLEFISNGGAYLPGLDNFIVDRTATFPVTHIVHFDKDAKISQIRLSWDQGSLLKQVEVIGARNRSWPIFDSKHQIKMITAGSSSAATTAPAPSLPRGRTEEPSEVYNRNSSPTKKYIKDPHASLNVFDPPREDENRRPNTSDPNYAPPPRESFKPPPREHSELFAAGHEDLAPSPDGSPSKKYKERVIAPKGAGARRFEKSHLFDDEEEVSEPKIYKTNPARYNHFDIGDHQEDDPMQHRSGSQTQQKDAPLIARGNKKNVSNWNFEDHTAPEKASQRQRREDQVHFSLEDQSSTPEKPAQGAKGRKDVDAHFDFMDDGTPVQRLPVQAKARKDAELHFEFRDDFTPAPRRIIGRNKAAAGIYSNPLEDDDEYDNGRKAPLSTITNNAGRKKDFESHWDAADSIPNDSKGTGTSISESKKKVVQSMGADWDNYEGSSEGSKKPIGNKGRRGVDSSWAFDDEQEDAPKTQRNRNTRQRDQSHWDF